MVIFNSYVKLPEGNRGKPYWKMMLVVAGNREGLKVTRSSLAQAEEGPAAKESTCGGRYHMHQKWSMAQSGVL